MVLRQVKHERDRKSLDQVRGHAACKPAEPHLQLETIFKEGSSLIKNPTLHVKWREELLSCFFYSLCLKKKKKKKSSTFQWKVPEPGLEPSKGVPPTVGSLTSSQQAPGLGRSPTRRGGVAAQGLVKISQEWAQPGVHPLFAQSGTSGPEGGHQCGMRRKEDPPPALSGTGWLPGEAKAGFAGSQGHGLLSDQWAGRTSPGVAPAAVSGHARSSQQLKTPSHSGTWLRADLHPTCADSTSANSVHGRVVPTKGQGPSPSGDSSRQAPN